jgi:HK97 family phage portal protein
MAVFYGIDEAPVEIAPGRGDLRFSSTPFEATGIGDVGLVDGKVVSYGRIFAEQPWVAVAVMRLLTWSARVPLKVYRRTGDDSRERLRPGQHPLATALANPWDGAGSIQLVMALLGSLFVHGNGTLGIQSGARDTLKFDEVDWRQMRPVQKAGRIVGWTRTVDGATSGLSVDDLVHLKWWSPLGPVGISPLQQLGATISIEDAAQRWQASLLRNSARPSSAISASTDFLGLDKDKRDVLLSNLRADVTALYSGPENGGRPVLLPPGLTWDNVGHTAVEAELIEQRKTTREEIAAVYMIPPPMIGQLDRATFSNITELRQVAYTDGLGPPLVLLEAALNTQVVRKLLREDDVYVEFDMGGVLRGDRLKEIQAIREAVGMALMTPNEGRSTLNYPRATEEGADALWLPRNNLQRLDAPEDEDAP